MTKTKELFEIGDPVVGRFRCDACDLQIESPSENDGVLVLGPCPLCQNGTWRRV